MTQTLRRSQAWVVWSALCALCGLGCAAEAPVLSSSGRLSTDDAFSGDAATVFGVCGSEVDGTLQILEYSGDACSFGGGCGVFSGCSGRAASCQDGRVNIVSYETLACDESSGLGGSASTPTWDDCQAALAGGESGDPCAANFECAAAADDPCCVDVATCQLLEEPAQSRLIRTRVCQEDCAELAPDPDGAPATDCRSAHDISPTGELISRVDQACSGDFICTMDGQDLNGTGTSEPPGPPGSHPGLGLRWCRDGIVLGVY